MVTAISLGGLNTGHTKVVADLIQLYTVREGAERLRVSPRRVHQLLREHQLAGFPGNDNQPRIPQEFFDKTGVVKGLPGTLTLLADAGYGDAEAIRWLCTV